MADVLTEKQGQLLLKLARKTLEKKLEKGSDSVAPTPG